MGNVSPHINSSIIKSDSADLPQGATLEHRGILRPVTRAHVGMYSGYASKGYASDYQRVPTIWVEVRIIDGDARIVRRRGWSFSGKNHEQRADFAYRSVLKNISETWPNCPSSSFPVSV